jgi:hypothetical protein
MQAMVSLISAAGIQLENPQAAPEVVKRVAGKPIASRRILAPDDKRDDDEDEARRNRS